MARNTSLTDCFVLINKGTALRGVTLEASLVLAKESHAAAFE
jgi:hypothetical protein